MRLSGSVDVEWGDPLIETAVGERRLVLLELRNDSREPAFVEVEGEHGRQVFVWRQSLHLAPGASRHTFIHVLPARVGPVSTSVRTHWSPGGFAEVPVRATGTPSAVTAPPMPDRAIRIHVRDGETGKPLAARLEVRDRDGEGFHEPLAGPSWAVPGTEYGWETPFGPLDLGSWFYADGEVTLGVDPEDKTVRAHHGFEYLPAEEAVRGGR